MDDLPDELLELIFGKLDGPALVYMGMMNHRFRRITRSVDLSENTEITWVKNKKPRFGTYRNAHIGFKVDMRFNLRQFSSAYAISLIGKNIKDVSMFSRVHTIDLSETPIADVEPLRNVHTVILDKCQNVTDISVLENVHTLSLKDCPIRDVSVLGRVHTLDLTGCSLIRDVSALGRVHTLNLTGCILVRDVSALKNVCCLSLRGCALVTDVSMLGGVELLDIRMCGYNLDITSLDLIPELLVTPASHRISQVDYNEFVELIARFEDADLETREFDTVLNFVWEQLHI